MRPARHCPLGREVELSAGEKERAGMACGAKEENRWQAGSPAGQDVPTAPVTAAGANGGPPTCLMSITKQGCQGHRLRLVGVRWGSEDPCGS